VQHRSAMITTPEKQNVHKIFDAALVPFVAFIPVNIRGRGD
jgi:hypothetical protein